LNRAPKGTPTDLNLWTLAETMGTKTRRSNRVEGTSMAGLRRCLKAGLVTTVGGGRHGAELVLTNDGITALEKSGHRVVAYCSGTCSNRVGHQRAISRREWATLPFMPSSPEVRSCNRCHTMITLEVPEVAANDEQITVIAGPVDTVAAACVERARAAFAELRASLDGVPGSHPTAELDAVGRWLATFPAVRS
jgi:hypothetical protein